MKATTRRNLALLFAFVMVLTILAGCAAKYAAESPASEDYEYYEEPAYEPEPAAQESAYRAE